jgi:hypothetical protein
VPWVPLSSKLRISAALGASNLAVIGTGVKRTDSGAVCDGQAKTIGVVGPQEVLHPEPVLSLDVGVPGIGAVRVPTDTYSHTEV